MWDKKHGLPGHEKRLLLVEGINDFHPILALRDRFNLPKSFEINTPKEGKDSPVKADGVKPLLRKLNAVLKENEGNPTRDTIGIVLDADVSLSARWQAIQAKLAGFRYQFPDQPDPVGTILPDNPGYPRFGVWIMPNNRDEGMLEDFLLEFLSDEFRSAASDAVDVARTKGVATFKEVHTSKATIHTFLAWQDEPGKPLGQAITANFLKPETETARAFADWLRRLFPHS